MNKEIEKDKTDSIITEQASKQASKQAVICCKLNKMPDGKLTSILNAEICDLDTPTASTITSRYYKGLGSHKDNMVLEIWREC